MNGKQPQKQFHLFLICPLGFETPKPAGAAEY
jgi:hypothetical protein